jgi:purine-binding chemotaxis protein CheW
MNQCCTFWLADRLFGIDVRRVQEIVPAQPMTPVPLAPATVRGLINLRGQIVTAIDLRRRLGFADRPAGQPPTNVIVQFEDVLLSFLVDRIGDVVPVSEGEFESPPDTLQGRVRELILGAYKLTDRLLLVLDVLKAAEIDPNDVQSP